MTPIEQLASQYISYKHSINQQREALVDMLKTIDHEVVDRATKVFGNDLAASNWLLTPIKTLNSTTPLDAIIKGDRTQVMDILGRIEHGVIS